MMVYLNVRFRWSFVTPSKPVVFHVNGYVNVINEHSIKRVSCQDCLSFSVKATKDFVSGVKISLIFSVFGRTTHDARRTFFYPQPPS